MASTNTSQEVAEGSVSERGFYCWQDISAGNRISEFAKRGFPYYTEYGLDFLTDFAAFNKYWKPISTDVSLRTGSDTKRYPISISNALGKAGLKLDGGFSWCMCVRKGRNFPNGGFYPRCSCLL
ncbi:hypothetical protein BHE90_016527 [Fusarium euwallaceae]|uniref:Uncharacterized protein n=1 Tax=Fusarium euwallaceae TaxID=1147111 RepID=A0A430L054_9HYPO|nr:hypothetical protein BHE90_016527 [Fusarium euwallaceae]